MYCMYEKNICVRTKSLCMPGISCLVSIKDCEKNCIVYEISLTPMAPPFFQVTHTK